METLFASLGNSFPLDFVEPFVDPVVDFQRFGMDVDREQVAFETWDLDNGLHLAHMQSPIDLQT